MKYIQKLGANNYNPA